MVKLLFIANNVISPYYFFTNTNHTAENNWNFPSKNWVRNQIFYFTKTIMQQKKSG